MKNNSTPKKELAFSRSGTRFKTKPHLSQNNLSPKIPFTQSLFQE